MSTIEGSTVLVTQCNLPSLSAGKVSHVFSDAGLKSSGHCMVHDVQSSVEVACIGAMIATASE